MIDNTARIASMKSYDVIKSLSINDIENFLRTIGVNRILKYKDYLILPTICHNPIDAARSMKLYYYDNHKCFHCYTECSDSMSIIELYMKFMSLNYHDISYSEALEYIKGFITNTAPVITEVKKSDYIYDEETYEYHDNIVTLPKFSNFVLDSFVKYYHPLWLRDGITKESMDKYDIRFSLSQNAIIIPHRDINGNLVGIRQRTINEDEIEAFGKYHPVTLNGKMYNHPLSYNLYGIDKNKEAIKKYKRAILVEGEKSVLLGDKYMGDNNICVAVCGSKINKYQIAILTDMLGVNEIIVAFDKDFSTRGKESRKCREKIVSQCKKYLNEALFSYVFDDFDLLEEHDSPLDKGKETWEKLYRGRIKVI